MSKYLDSNGLLYLWGKIKSYVAAYVGEHGGGGTADSVAWENVTGKPELAALPEEGNQPGDVWNVEDTGMNYAWTGTGWDALGAAFEIQAITNAEIDAITAEA